jgi:hypothetical protein
MKQLRTAIWIEDVGDQLEVRLNDESDSSLQYTLLSRARTEGAAINHAIRRLGRHIRELKKMEASDE